MIVGRRISWPVVIVVAVAFALLLVAFYRREFYTSGLPWHISGHAPEGENVEAEKPEAESTEIENVEVDFDNAHRLPSPDAFRDHHFERVLALPHLSVNETKRTCTWKPEDKVNYMFGDDVAWNLEDRPDGELEMARHKWQEFIRHDLIPYDEVKSRFKGRGIAVLSGNGDTQERTKVLLRAMKRLGSAVPVEVHYYADEMNEARMQELTSIYPNTHFNDLAGEHNVLETHFNPDWLNYQLKSASIVNSRFAEVLLLDSDNIPVFDPAELWETPTYQEFGTIFWPDIARTRAPNPAWAITNTFCRMDEYEQESGQVVVDKSRFWYHIQLAAHMNNDPDRYYDGFLLGDKDTFRFAWHALKTRYGQPRRWLTSVGTQNGDAYCGHTFAQHHPDDGRVAFLHGGLLKTFSPEVLRWNRDVKGGVFRHYKRAATDEDPSRLVDCGLKWDGADYVPDHSPEFHIQSCADMYDTEARDLEEILPGYEQVFRDIGGYWLIDEPVSDEVAISEEEVDE